MILNYGLTNGKPAHNTKRTRKIAHRLLLQGKVETLLRSCYHNATLGSWNVSNEKIFSPEDQWEEVNFYLEMTLNDINANRLIPEYIEGRISRDWGAVSTFGRGGRTCVPNEWIELGGNRFFNNPQLSDLPRSKLWKLLIDIPEWNGYVKSVCSSKNLQSIIDERYTMLKEERDENMRNYAQLLTI